MKLIERILEWITDYRPGRYIGDNSGPYLERYYLFTFLGYVFYLHRFAGSDNDRELHDHPWVRAFSIVLSGWYWETTRTGVSKTKVFNKLHGDTFHRVTLPKKYGKDEPCWTLFFHRHGRAKEWGFLRDQGDGTFLFIPYKYEREGSQKDWWLRAPVGRVFKLQLKAAGFR